MPDQKIYRAKRNGLWYQVTVNGQPLAAPRPIQINGELLPAAAFEWGNDSEGSKYLAYCIFHDFAPDLAENLFERLYHDFIIEITEDEWTLTGEEMQEGIDFWGESMRIIGSHRPGEEYPRLVIPDFIYKVFIKSVEFPGRTVNPKDVEQSIRKIKARSATSVRVNEGVDPSSLAPLLRAGK